MITHLPIVASDWPQPLPVRVVAGSASARAAAYSLRRAGCAPIAADSFGDQDLLAICPPHLVETADSADLPWIYLGGMENDPDRIDALARRSPLLGISGQPLRAARDPFRVAQVARAAGFPFPETRASAPIAPSASEEWLIKPLASAGGIGIRRWLGGRSPANETANESHYFQKRIEGEPLSAIFVASLDSASCRLHGVTRQSLRRDDEAEFMYEGSMGPWPVSNLAYSRIERLGAVLARNLGLSGLFGVDFQLAGDEPWTIEINPRYTASIEILEWATGRSIWAEHLRTFGVPARLDEPAPNGQDRPRFVAKRILWADRPCRWIGDWRPPSSLWEIPDVADVPHRDATIPSGAPILTAVVRGDSIEECSRRLEIREKSIRSSLKPV